MRLIFREDSEYFVEHEGVLYTLAMGFRSLGSIAISIKYRIEIKYPSYVEEGGELEVSPLIDVGDEKSEWAEPTSEERQFIDQMYDYRYATNYLIEVSCSPGEEVGMEITLELLGAGWTLEELKRIRFATPRDVRENSARILAEVAALLGLPK